MSEPVAWAVKFDCDESIRMNGGPVYRVCATRDEADRIAANALAVVPLYEAPTLTGDEADLLLWLSSAGDEERIASKTITPAARETLRGLLRRGGNHG